MKDKIKIAFIKFAGTGAFGTEKFLQNIAINLPKNKFDIDYYYTNAAPYIGSDWKHPPNSTEREKILKDNGINLIPIHVEFKDVTKPEHPWVGTDFWDHFDESKYDIIQNGIAGHREYPFNKILNTPIIDSIHLAGHNHFQSNVSAVIHVSNWNKDIWIKGGGNKDIAHVVYLPIELPTDFNRELFYDKFPNLKNKFIFGFHQRPDDAIYSNIPLEAYSKIENENTAFVVLGGSKFYSQQAKNLNLKNYIQLEPTSNMQEIMSFLSVLKVYTHGRKDGENNSQSIAEAMGSGLPIISHKAVSNGHVEQVGDCGYVVENLEQYLNKMEYLLKNESIRLLLAETAKNRFNQLYNLQTNVNKIVNIYENVINENRLKREKDKWLFEWLED